MDVTNYQDMRNEIQALREILENHDINECYRGMILLYEAASQIYRCFEFSCTNSSKRRSELWPKLFKQRIDTHHLEDFCKHPTIKKVCEAVCESIQWTPELEGTRYQLALKRNAEVHLVWTEQEIAMLKNYLKNERLKRRLLELDIDHSLCMDMVEKFHNLCKEAETVKETGKMITERQTASLLRELQGEVSSVGRRGKGEGRRSMKCK